MSELRPEEYIGEEVIVTGAYGDKWRGKAVAYSDKPSVLVEYEDGSRMMLPARGMRLVSPRKPWHDAQPGEVWVVRVENGTVSEEMALTCVESYGELWLEDPVDETRILITGSIVEGRRIWPEDSNDS